ncbi:MAG: C40 family peptidase [Pseudomonadota bacterium]|nr:C40 family peptidase [Pseudomonadota bacterium]
MHKQDLSRRKLGQLMSCLSVLVLAGCATRPTARLRSARSERAASDVAGYALSLVNSPYVWGGRDAGTGFDCSGLVSHVYLQAAGIELQGSAASMARAAQPVGSAEVMAGDLVFFNTLGRPFSHVGIYVDGGRFVHASNARTGVRIDRLDSKYYAARFEGARMLLG